MPIPSTELEPFVDGVVGTAMARDHIVGVTVSIVQSGQVMLKKGYGFAGLAGRSIPTARCFASAPSQKPLPGLP